MFALADRDKEASGGAARIAALPLLSSQPEALNPEYRLVSLFSVASVYNYINSLEKLSPPQRLSSIFNLL